MPRTKYEDDMIVRNYPVRCPVCKEETRIDWEQDTCEKCGAFICPDCLTPAKDNVNESKRPNYIHGGYSLTVTCKKCGYHIVDTDVLF